MVGKGSINHNSRVFNAKNTDPERTHRNIEYCNEKITDVYHQLFDEAQKRYNAKQKRADRKIENYYEKIRTGKQEKTFHEIILQIGDHNDMSAKDENGELAERILDEYFRSFQERNPYLKVFSAHLHMDEATPHLHIDFVPFTTGSKRGMDTRVSLKQALANQGFVGNSKHESEWSLWVLAEKKELAAVMEKYGIEWEHKGTHEEHLSDYDYKKKVRAKEVEALTKKSEELNIKVDELNARVSNLMEFENEMEEISNQFYNEEKFQLPEPPPLMSAKTYKTKFVEPLIKRLLAIAKTAVKRCFEMKERLDNISYELRCKYGDEERYRKENQKLYRENEKLTHEVQDFRLLRKIFGDERIINMINEARRADYEQRTARFKKPKRTVHKPKDRDVR